MKDWIPKAAVLWADMERGLYDWKSLGKKVPRNGDGKPRVVRKQILIDCGISPSYGDNLWHKSEEFLRALDAENKRRDQGISDVVAKIEETSGPLMQLRQTMSEHVQAIFEAGPDPDGEVGLRPREYVHEALPYMRYLDELTGRTKSQEQQAIEGVLSALSQNQQITGAIASRALDLVEQFNDEQKRKLASAGFIDGTLER